MMQFAKRKLDSSVSALKRFILGYSLSDEKKNAADLSKMSFKINGQSIEEPEVIASPSDPHASKSEEPSKETERIEIPEEIKELILIYAGYSNGLRQWEQEVYRMQKTVQNGTKAMDQIIDLKKTRFQKLRVGKDSPDLSYKAMQEKTRRWNKQLRDDGFIKTDQLRKVDLKKRGFCQNSTKNLGRYCSNHTTMSEKGFKALEFLDQHHMLYRSSKDIKKFAETGIKSPIKRKGSNPKCGTGSMENVERAPSDIDDKDLEGKDRSFRSASTDPLGSEKKEPPKEAKELSLWMPKELEKRLGLIETEPALTAQTKTLLKNNGNDLGKAKKQYRVFLEVVKDPKIRNKKGWLQTAIDGNFEFEEEESVPTNPPPPKEPHTKASEVSPQEKSAIKEIVQTLEKLSLANRITPKIPFIWFRRFPDLERILNALWAVFEQIRKGNEIKNPEAYITKAIQEGYRPKNHTVEEYRTIYRNMEELERRIPSLKTTKGIDVTNQKIYIDKKPRWEIVLKRGKVCSGQAELAIAIVNPRLGELITNFEQKHDAEKNNISENEGWLKETVKELEQTYEKLKTKRTETGYRLMMPMEMISDGKTLRFIDHLNIGLAKSKKEIQRDLNAFLERNKIGRAA